MANLIVDATHHHAPTTVVSRVAVATQPTQGLFHI
jgi:hypothetical protein